MIAFLVRLFGTVALRGAVTMTAAGSVAGFGSNFHDLRGELPVRSDMSYTIRPEGQVQGVVFHHSATSGQSIKSIAHFHTEVRKWPAIAYHFAIGYDGVVYELNDVTRASYHAQGHNRNTIGVVLIGNYESRELTEEMENSIIMLNEYLKDRYDLKFAWMHGETKSTLCPGKNAKAFIRPYLYGPRP